MSGLGIDLGSDHMTHARRPSGPRERSHSRSRSHTVSSETRRVRIASGQPHILGDDDLHSPGLDMLGTATAAKRPSTLMAKAHGGLPHRSVSMAAGPTPPLSVSDGGTDGLGIFDSYTDESKEGYVPDGFGGWVKEEDIGAGRAPVPITPSDSPLIIPPPPKNKLRITNPSPSRSLLTPPTSEPATSPEVRLQALPPATQKGGGGPQSPASLALSDITVSSKSSGSSSQRKVRKLISSRRPSSAAGDAPSERTRSRSRSMSLFLGRPKSASGLREDKDKNGEEGSASSKSSPSKGMGRNKLSKSRSHASLVSWSATGWAGTGQTQGLGLDLDDAKPMASAGDDDAHGSPGSESAYSDNYEDALDQTITAGGHHKEAFRGPAQQLYDSPVRAFVDETPRQEHASDRNVSHSDRDRALRSNTRSSSRLNAQAAEFNPRPPTAVAMAPTASLSHNPGTGTGNAPVRQLSNNSIASATTFDSSTTATGGMPPMRSMRFWAGLEGASRGEAMVCLDPLTGQFVQGEAIVPGRIVSGHNAGLGVNQGSILADPTPGADPCDSTNSARRDEALRQTTTGNGGGRPGSSASGRYESASMSRRDSHMSWGAESTSSLGPHDSASNVGRTLPARPPPQDRHAQGPKTIHRQQSVPVLPSASTRVASQANGPRAGGLHHQQSFNALGLEMNGPGVDMGARAGGAGAGAGAASMDRRANHTVSGASISAEERRRRQSTMTTTTSNLTTSSSSSTGLDRSGTLLSATANPARRSRELNRLLGNSARKLSASAAKAAAMEKAAAGMGGEGDEESSSVGPAGGSGGSTTASSGLGIEGLNGPPSGTVLAGSNATRLNGGGSGAPSSVGPAGPVTSVGTNSSSIAVLEQAKSGRARVEVDLVLETDLVVEGGSLRGRLQIKVRKPNEGEGTVMLAQPKIRIVGFEELLGDDTRHIFYHHAMTIDGDRSNGGPSEPYVLHGSPNLFSPEAEGRLPLPCFAGPQDGEGYCRGVEGTHSIPFALDIPIGKGAKGSYRGKTAVVRYIVIGSVKLKGSMGADRSIAHFYRHIELFPYLNPAVVLAAAPRPLVSSGEKGLFMGGSGKVLLTASLHRSTWVAGQRVYVNIGVRNETTKKVKNLHLALVRTVTLFRPKPEFNVGFSVPADPTESSYIDPDACSTSTTRKKICEDTLELGQKGSKGSVTARGWWTGVDPGCSLDVSHYMTIPAEALTILRGRHVEVMYSIKVAVSGTLSSDVSVELPLRVINFVSLDPPPTKHSSKSSFGTSSMAMSRSWSQAAHSDGSALPHALPSPTTRIDEAPMIARVRSMDAVLSPTKVDVTPRHQLHLPLPTSSRVAAQGANAQGDSERQNLRRLQHQKSLDFINHAIRSATARRGLPSSAANSPLGLGIEVPDDSELESMEYRETQGQGTGAGAGLGAPGSGILPTDHLRRLSMASIHSQASQSTVGPIDPNCLPYVHPHAAMPHLVPPVLSVNPQLLLNSVTLDEAGDDYDELDRHSASGRRGSALGSVTGTPMSMNDDSVDEIDMVVHSTQMEGLPVFGVPRAQPDDGDEEEDGDTTFDSVSTARCIREEPEAEEAEGRAQAGRLPSPADVTAPLQFSKRTASAPHTTGQAEPATLDDESTPMSFQSSTFSCDALGSDQGSPTSVSSESEIGTAEVSLHLSPASDQSQSPVTEDGSSPAGGERRKSVHDRGGSDGGVGAFASQVSEQARQSHAKKGRGGRGRGRDKQVDAGQGSAQTQLEGIQDDTISPLSNSVQPSPAGSLRRARSNLEDGSSTTSSRPSSRASVHRPTSPSKLAGSPKKSALKTKSSFTFATLDTPLKMQRDQMASMAVPGSAVDAADSASAVTGGSDLVDGQTELKVKVKAKAATSTKASTASPASSTASGPTARSGRPAAAAAKTTPTTTSSSISSKSAVPALAAKVGPKTREAPPALKAKVSSSTLMKTGDAASSSDSNSSTNSRKSKASGPAPVGRTSSTPAPAAQPAAASSSTASVSRNPSLRQTASLADIGQSGRKSISRRSVAPSSAAAAGSMEDGEAHPERSTSVASISTAKGSSSGEDKDKDKDKGLHRSSSTHNLRGSAIVIPSVRNKIALLESRSQLLRDFTAPALAAAAGGVSPSVSSSSYAASPAPGGDTSVGEMPVRRAGAGAGAARVSNVSAMTVSSSTGSGLSRKLSTTSLAAGTGTPTGRVRTSTLSGSSPSTSSNNHASGVMSGSMSMGRLARKASVLSIAASEDSVASTALSGGGGGSRPEYLKRSDSLMSFKAPVLRSSVKALVQERERAAGGEP
ncbi:hypothetical protein OC844_002583 [Tilletia horrida]|nr:hypothetical protein OC844_002583 [Tilletia horrida]